MSLGEALMDLKLLNKTQYVTIQPGNNSTATAPTNAANVIAIAIRKYVITVRFILSVTPCRGNRVSVMAFWMSFLCKRLS